MTASRAGEGGGLPKGLSLFRFILFSSIMLGSCYGGAAIYFNAPPPPGDIPPHGVPSAQWEPSPLWLPSFLVIKFNLGVKPSPLGYVYSGRSGQAIFGSVAILFGMLIFGVIGWFGGEQVRRWVVRKRYE